MTSPSEAGTGGDAFIAETKALAKLVEGMKAVEVDSDILVRLIKLIEIASVSPGHALLVRKSLDAVLKQLIELVQLQDVVRLFLEIFPEGKKP